MDFKATSVFFRNLLLLCTSAVLFSGCVLYVPFLKSDFDDSKQNKSCNNRESQYQYIPTASGSFTRVSTLPVQSKTRRSGNKRQHRLNLLLSQLQHSSDAALRTNAATDLGFMGSYARPAVLPLTRALKYDKSKWVRRAAAKSLPKISTDKRVVQALQAATRDRNKWVAHSASRALHRIGTQRGSLYFRSRAS